MTRGRPHGLSDALSALVRDELDVADVLAHLVSYCAEATGADAVAILALDGDAVPGPEGGNPISLLAATSHRVADLEMLQAQRLSGPASTPWPDAPR